MLFVEIQAAGEPPTTVAKAEEAQVEELFGLQQKFNNILALSEKLEMAFVRGGHMQWKSGNAAKHNVRRDEGWDMKQGC